MINIPFLNPYIITLSHFDGFLGLFLGSVIFLGSVHWLRGLLDV